MKTVMVSVKTGSAPTFRTTMNIDVVPPLFELPEPLIADGIKYTGVPLEVFPQTVVSAGNYADGAEVNVKFAGTETSAHLLQVGGKQGVTVKEARELPKDLLMLDGKPIGEYQANSKNSLTLFMPANANFHTRMQKVIRSFVFATQHEMTSDMWVELQVLDCARLYTRTAKVKVWTDPK